MKKADAQEAGWAVAIAVAVIATMALLWVGLGAENDRERLKDAERDYADIMDLPWPTVTETVTKTPPPPPPKTVIKTVKVTVEPARASRSLTRTSSSVSGWKQRYWDEAQVWARTSKTRAVIMCESTNRVNAVSPTGKYRGLYQMDKGKWASYGGLELAPRPDLATRAEQNYVAYRIYVGNGWGPWECA